MATTTSGPATATAPSERVSFRQINKKTGNRIRYQSVDEGTREPVDLADKGKGYEFDKDQFIMVEDEELKRTLQEKVNALAMDRTSIVFPSPGTPSSSTRATSPGET